MSHPVPVPVAQACGTALPYSGVVRREQTNNTDRVILFHSNIGIAGTVGLLVGLPATPNLIPLTIPTLALGDDNGGPTSAKAMKASLNIVNVTAPFTIGGRVSVLNARQRVRLPVAPASMTKAQWDTFIDDVKAHPDTMPFSGGEFLHGREFPCMPIDDSYNEFDEFLGTIDSNTFLSAVAIWPGLVPYKRRMTCNVVIFEVPAAPQEYTLTLKAGYYTRWPLNSVPGQSQVKVRTAPLTTINQAIARLEALGSGGHAPASDSVG